MDSENNSAHRNRIHNQHWLSVGTAQAWIKNLIDTETTLLVARSPWMIKWLVSYETVLTPGTIGKVLKFILLLIKTFKVGVRIHILVKWFFFFFSSENSLRNTINIVMKCAFIRENPKMYNRYEFDIFVIIKIIILLIFFKIDKCYF